MKKVTILMTALLLVGGLALQSRAFAQDEGRIVFTDPKSKDNITLSEEEYAPATSMGGVDIMLGDDGFGLGFFYHYIFTDELTAFANLSFSETQDSRQRSYYSIWGEEIPINKINHILRIPLFFGLQYRLFKEDIVDNFRPFVNGGVGPVMLFVAPTKVNNESKDLLGAIPYGSPKYSYGGFLGAGAQFGFDKSSILGVNVRYYLVKAPSGLRAVEQGELSNANGFFITLNLGTAF